MKFLTVVLLLLYCSDVCVHSVKGQRCNRQAQDECIYSENSTLLCGPNSKHCVNLDITDEDYRIPVDTTLIQLSECNYDVHTYRLCGNEVSSGLTSEEGQKCSPANKQSTITIRFRDCNEYFTSIHDGNIPDLEIYFFINSSCARQYRFLIVNTTRKIIIGKSYNQL